MTQHDIDPERIARLLEGNLDAGEREKLLAEIAASEGATEVLGDVMAVIGEGESAKVAVTAPPARREGLRRIHPSIWMGLAAGIIAVLFVPRALRTPEAPPSGTDFVTLLAMPAAPWPEADRTPWGRTRGAGGASSDAARAVRLGARLTELEIALRSGDSTDRRIAADIAAMVAEIPGGSLVAAKLRDTASTKIDVRALFDDVAAIAGPEEVGAGAWLQAARVAAERGDSLFFVSAPSKAMAARLGVRSRDEKTLTDMLAAKSK